MTCQCNLSSNQTESISSSAYPLQYHYFQNNDIERGRKRCSQTILDDDESSFYKKIKTQLDHTDTDTYNVYAYKRVVGPIIHLITL